MFFKVTRFMVWGFKVSIDTFGLVEVLDNQYFVNS